jgi:hypothetical protein
MTHYFKIFNSVLTKNLETDSTFLEFFFSKFSRIFRIFKFNLSVFQKLVKRKEDAIRKQLSRPGEAAARGAIGGCNSAVCGQSSAFRLTRCER